MSTENILKEARPRTEEEWGTLPACPEILDWLPKRGVTEVMHFTLPSNLIGILASGYLKSRLRAGKDPAVEHVHLPNAPNRERDKEWIDYASLSISQINDWLFGSSESRWHPDTRLVILSFAPEIMCHAGVVFCTTNNAYPQCLRSRGLQGLQRLFEEGVIGHNGGVYRRFEAKPLQYTTDRRAELLYPGQLSIEFLQRIYVQTDEASENVHGICGGLSMDIEIVIAPEVFR
jgi:hypothetical protein